MKKQKLNKKLVLSKTTVVNLDGNVMGNVVGGFVPTDRCTAIRIMCDPTTKLPADTAAYDCYDDPHYTQVDINCHAV
ncbi:MAG: hypothetical protein GY765_13910 [bacterium]|nr:hypothetical protein [bacterium]